MAPTSASKRTSSIGGIEGRTASPNGSRPRLPTVHKPNVNLCSGRGVYASFGIFITSAFGLRSPSLFCIAVGCSILHDRCEDRNLAYLGELLGVIRVGPWLKYGFLTLSIHLSSRRGPFSLTPHFSEVRTSASNAEPFQRFHPVDRKTVETVENKPDARTDTSLK